MSSPTLIPGTLHFHTINLNSLSFPLIITILLYDKLSSFPSYVVGLVDWFLGFPLYWLLSCCCGLSMIMPKRTNYIGWTLKFYIFREKFLYKFSIFYINQLKNHANSLGQVHNAYTVRKTQKMNNNHEEYNLEIHIL